MRFTKLFILIICSTVFMGSMVGQGWVSYQSQQQINDLVDTGQELILATDQGVVFVDKASLAKTILDVPGSIGRNHIQSVTRTSNGVWIGTYDVVMARISEGGLEDVSMPAHTAFTENTMLYDFEFAPNGDLWVATTDGIFHRVAEQWSFYSYDDISPSIFEVWDIEFNTAGELFLGGSTVFKLEDGQWLNTMEGLDFFSYSDKSELFESSNGDLFYAGDLNSLARFHNQEWELTNTSSIAPQLNGFDIVNFTENANGEVFFTTKENGVFKLTNDTWEPVATELTTPFNNATSYFYIDSDGTQWLNNSIHLVREQDGVIASTTISEYALDYNGISKIRKSSSGDLYFIGDNTWTIGVLGTDDEWSHLPLPANPTIIEDLQDVLVIAEDDIWLSAFYSLYHFDGEEWELFDAFGSKTLAMDSQGKIYVENSLKIDVIENGVTSHSLDPSDFSSDAGSFAELGVDASDNLWMVTSNNNEVIRLSPSGNWTRYGSEVHPAITDISGDFHFDVNGNIWIPTLTNGPLLFDGTDWSKPFVENEELLESTDVHSITSDENGKVYFSYSAGVMTWEDGEWETLLIGQLPTNQAYHKTSIVLDDEGTLWWGSSIYGVYAYEAGITNTADAWGRVANELSIFPNPANTYSTISLELIGQSTIQIRLFNQLGQAALERDLGDAPAGAFRYELDVTTLPKGGYWLQIQVNNSTTTQQLIIH